MSRRTRLDNSAKDYPKPTTTDWTAYYEPMRKGHLFPDYDSKITLSLYKRYVPKLVKRFSRKKEFTILEPGSGIGRFSLVIAEEAKFNNVQSYVIGIDMLESILKDAKKLFRERGVCADFIVADVRLLPFRDECFDLAHSQGLHEHFTGLDRQRTFDEVNRVLVKGGYYFFTVPNKLNLFWSFSLLKAKVLRRASAFIDEKPFTIKELIKNLRRSGFVVLKIGGINCIYNYLFLLGHIDKVFAILRMIDLEAIIRRRLVLSKNYGEGARWLIRGRALWALAVKP